MNHIWVKQEQNVLTNSQGPLSQELYLSRQNDNHRLKPRAYINPQIVNYDYIKRSLTNSILSGNKIHVNPNFRGNCFSNLQRNLDSNTIVNSNQVAVSEPGTSNIPNCDTRVLSGRSELCVTTSRPATQFKKINNISFKSTNRSKFSWCKSENNANVISSIHNKKKEIFSEETSNCGKSKTVFPTQNNYKYTAPRKLTKVVKTDKNTIPIHKSKTKIINKSKTKLINAVSAKNKQVKTHLPVKKPSSLSRFKYIKNRKSSVAMATALKNKYKYTNHIMAKQCRNSKYKIDKRKKLPETPKKKSSGAHDIRKLFPSNFHSSVVLYKRPHQYYPSTPVKNGYFWRKNLTPPEKINEKRINRFPNRRVVKIGGILYKSTANKLTLACKKSQLENSKKSITTKEKVGKNHIVYVRGEKFILDKNGKTLRRQSQREISSNTPKRIDIGGITYMQESQNVLIRTNVHRARYLVKKAKNKSIATLTNLYRRSAMPCMIYHRFGKCNRHTKGLCMYNHDPKNIAICKKFLKGDCENKNCLLSHEVIQEKMATCRFFLNGFCARENCPFLHVKLNKNTSICKNFLQGFCKLGKNCSKRHLHQCPDFDKNGTCALGTKCHYPHKVPDKELASSEQSSNKEPEEKETVQYYLKSLHPCSKQRRGKMKGSGESKQGQNKKKKGTKEKNLSLNTCEQSSDDTIECVPKRIKLEKLPCYIPLKADP